MATANQSWPVSTDFKVTLSGLKDDSGAYINAASVTAVMQDASGQVVQNTNPGGGTTITFTPNSPNTVGVYTAIISNAAALLDSHDYTLMITAVQSGKQALLKMTRTANYIVV